MKNETDLTTYLPERWRSTAGKQGPGLDLRSPFVLPGASLRRMTGAVTTASGLILARGRLDGRLFHLQDVAFHPADDPDAPPLRSRGMEPVCVCLPRTQTLVRHFRVPAETGAEIDAMLPHLLTGELPMSLDKVSWVWTPLPFADEGTTLVAVYVARNDRLDDFLAPLVAADLNIVGLIPESWCWLQVMRPLCGGGDGDACSVLIRNHATHQLVVARDGQLMFDMAVPLSACPDPDTLDWDGPGFAEARTEFHALLGFPLPHPDIWPTALVADASVDPESVCFAASVAAAGLEATRLMAPHTLQQSSLRRTVLGTLANVGWLLGLAFLVWVGLALVEDTRTHKYLAALETQLEADAARVQELEMEYNAIRDNNRERAGSTEILQVLNHLRNKVDPPVYLAHLNYVQNRGVSLRGGAPTSRHVLEMTEKLAADPLWEGLRVMQLRSEKAQGTEQVHFVIEGQLNQ